MLSVFGSGTQYVLAFGRHSKGEYMELELSHIEDALSKGCKLRAFLSGGGLRVVRIEDKDGELKGYGEHPYIEDALAHANIDASYGHRPYEEVYGKELPHYLTENTSPISSLDAWVCKGNKFCITKVDGTYIFDLLSYQSFETPDNIRDLAIANSTRVEWSDRGFRYCAEPSNFLNGEQTISTSVISQTPNAKGTHPFMWQIKKTGCAPVLWDALEAAWSADPVELKES